jgi:RNA polymerase sigma factor (sigma-70 family)
MKMTDIQKLLAEYARTGSEAAFRDLVGRYVNLVYSAAVRLVNSDTYLAEDVTQTVFVDLAKMARKLPVDVLLGGWLHRHTCFIASNIMRGERRRVARERLATEMNAFQNEPDAHLEQVAPVLDEAINQLNTEDRTAILLRFFEQNDFRTVAEALGSTEEAAKKRVSRALDKLRHLLTARGVTLSATALATALAAEAVRAAPPALVSSIAASALGSAAITHAATFNLFKFMTASKLSLGVAGAVVVAGVAYSAKQHQIQAKLRDETSALREQVEQSRKEALGFSNQLARLRSNQPGLDEQGRELMRLRGEVAALRRQLADVPNAAAKAAQGQVTVPSQQPTSQTMTRARDAKILGYAFHVYAQKHDEQFPADFGQVVPYIAEGLRSDLNPGDALRNEAEFISAVTNQFEIVYHGSLTNLTDMGVILLREKQATQTSNGTWVKAYCFADGSGQIHEEPSGNFDVWEKSHMGP